EEKCSMCMACLNICPKNAIEFGENTEGRRRYVNPVFKDRHIGIYPDYI
ncbi:MAG: 4Fe-4S binding protein, partial [Candidatus Methanomethylophilaceae archaeon]|nr:4Fe-4S binding protein [Candidatus Methanomethylophilaceae archaeon]